jgi:hypothetical protein
MLIKPSQLPIARHLPRALAFQISSDLAAHRRFSSSYPRSPPRLEQTLFLKRLPPFQNTIIKTFCLGENDKSVRHQHFRQQLSSFAIPIVILNPQGSPTLNQDVGIFEDYDVEEGCQGTQGQGSREGHGWQRCPGQGSIQACAHARSRRCIEWCPVKLEERGPT